MNCMWWLEQKKPIDNTIKSRTIYNNMVSELVTRHPVIHLTPDYVFKDNLYYYNAIPFLSKSLDVKDISDISTEPCVIYFNETIPGYDILNGKYGFVFKLTDNRLVYLVYDNSKDLYNHVKFLLACINADEKYEKKLTEQRIILSKKARKLTNNLCFVSSPALPDEVYFSNQIGDHQDALEKTKKNLLTSQRKRERIKKGIKNGTFHSENYSNM